MLVTQANLKEMHDWETFIAISFHEMKLKEGLMYDKHSDLLVGFVALQGVNNHLLDVERQCQSDTPLPPTLASHMLVVFMRRFHSPQLPACTVSLMWNCSSPDLPHYNRGNHAIRIVCISCYFYN